MMHYDTVKDALNKMTNRNVELYMEMIWDVAEFNSKFEIKTDIDLQSKLVCEEVFEWMEELLNYGMTTNLMKETIDILYVLEGLAVMLMNEEKTEFEVYNEEKLRKAIAYINDTISNVANLFEEYETLSAWKKVHKSNMSKLDVDGNVIRREDGKVLKSDLYKPADLSDVVNKYTTIEILEDIKEELTED
jgi:hypothetical protein